MVWYASSRIGHAHIQLVSRSIILRFCPANTIAGEVRVKHFQSNRVSGDGERRERDSLSRRRPSVVGGGV